MGGSRKWPVLLTFRTIFIDDLTPLVSWWIRKVINHVDIIYGRSLNSNSMLLLTMGQILFEVAYEYFFVSKQGFGKRIIALTFKGGWIVNAHNIRIFLIDTNFLI